jgi:membrane protein implicated in regulation of membrane protease activity
MNTGGRGTYILREIAELVLFVAILVVVAQFVPLPIWVWLGVPFGKILFSTTMYLFFFRRSLLRRSHIGPEALIGRTAKTLTPLNPSGQVRVNGEIWSARSYDGTMIPEQRRVAIRRVAGHTVYVVEVP